MNSTNHLSAEDLTLFALQLLEGEERRDAAQHLQHCAECRAEVARVQGDLAVYALAASEPASPPAAARERLLEAAAKEKKAPPMERTIPARAAAGANGSRAAEPPQVRREMPGRDDGELFLASRGRRMFEAEHADEEERRPRSAAGAASWLGWAGWAIAAGMAVVAGLQFRERQAVQADLATQTAKVNSQSDELTEARDALHALTSEGAMQVALHVPVNGAPEPPKPEGHAAYDAQHGALVFIGEHLQPLAPEKTYELWLLPADKDGQKSPPIPAGLFRPDGRGVGRVVMPEIPRGVAAVGFGVTIENDGGSKTPTLPIVLAGM